MGSSGTCPWGHVEWPPTAEANRVNTAMCTTHTHTCVGHIVHSPSSQSSGIHTRQSLTIIKYVCILSASLLEVVFQEDWRRGEGGGGCEVEGHVCAASLGSAPWASSVGLRTSKCPNKENGSIHTSLQITTRYQLDLPSCLSRVSKLVFHTNTCTVSDQNRYTSYG